MNTEVLALRAELVAVRSLIRQLDARVNELETRLEGFEFVTAEEPPSASSVPAQAASFTPPTRVAGSDPPVQALTGETVFSDGSCSRSPGSPTSAFRVALAQQVGRFLRSCLEGGHRKSSGRDLLNLQSRYYIVVRDFAGLTYDPPRIYTAFSKVKPLCLRGFEKGDAVFIGLPSQAEVRIALSAARLACPAGSFDA